MAHIQNKELSAGELKQIAWAYFLGTMKNDALQVGRYIDPLLSRTFQNHAMIISSLASPDQEVKIRLLGRSRASAQLRIRFFSKTGKEINLELGLRSFPEQGMQIIRAALL